MARIRIACIIQLHFRREEVVQRVCTVREGYYIEVRAEVGSSYTYAKMIASCTGDERDSARDQAST